jgi:16S rRNA (guanine966-N2)-methyltransferase
VRPTAARVREALFSILGQDLSGDRVLDLFAGAGSLGIEAASRGAKRVVFVEQSRAHARVLAANVALLDGIAEVVVRTADARRVLRGLAAAGERFDLVLLDPPYGKGLATEALTALEAVADQLLGQDTVVVVETDGRDALPERIGALVRSGPRRYGDTELWLYQANSTRADHPPREDG